MFNMNYDEAQFAQLPIVGDQRLTFSPKAKRSKKEEEWLREVKTYEFTNVEQPGCPVDFVYGSTKCSMRFHIEHGQKLRLPRHIALHLESIGRPIYELDDEPLKRKQGHTMVAHDMKKMVGRSQRFVCREQFEHTIG